MEQHADEEEREEGEGKSVRGRAVAAGTVRSLWGLHARNLIVPTGGIFGASYELKAEAAQAAAPPPGAVLALLGAAQSLPGKWNTLQNDIAIGVGRRTRQGHYVQAG